MTELRILFRVLFKCLWLGSDLFQIFMIKLKFFSAMTEFRLLYKNLLPNSDFFQTLVLATERKPLFKYLSSSYDFFFSCVWQSSDLCPEIYDNIQTFSYICSNIYEFLFRNLCPSSNFCSDTISASWNDHKCLSKILSWDIVVPAGNNHN